uniref:AlNc14C13G1568 protein n=1 Tax=Albugo laibachii Nc14 TaxID=890382 RepID=F0W3K6_9STRA|nr:AlNc14C13G1568 [Albugo laibachii Nc14]CCA16287.1 AlNc14C20G2062 [Albugo laibachii Nc14]|eukprot:CCA16287.1 AlNc14C20G2062 [Albugo laibachii Nc14]
MDERHNATIRSFSALNFSLDQLGKKIIDSNREMTKKITDDFNEKFMMAFQAIAIQHGRLFESHGIARNQVTAYLSDMETRLMLLSSDANKHNTSALVKEPVGGGIYELQHLSEQKKYIRNKTGVLQMINFFFGHHR